MISLARLLIHDPPSLSEAVAHDQTKAFLPQRFPPNPLIDLHPKAFHLLHRQEASGYDGHDLGNATNVGRGWEVDSPDDDETRSASSF